MQGEKTKEIRIIVPQEFSPRFIPRKMCQHLLNAEKEFLLTMRSVIDAKIDRLEKRRKKPAKKKKDVSPQ